MIPPKLVVLPMLHGWIPFGRAIQAPSLKAQPVLTPACRPRTRDIIDARILFTWTVMRAASLPSKITWDSFWGIFEPNVTLQTSGTAVKSDGPISSPTYDGIEIKL